MIHPTAVIDPSAQLGTNVSIGAFTVIDHDVIIGDNTQIDIHAVIKPFTSIGQDCRIFAGAILGEIPQDLKFGGEQTNLEIGNRTTIREYCTLNRGTDASGKTVIGNDVLLMAYVHVGHDCILSDKVILANGISLGGHVEIGYHASIGGHTPVHQFCRIGTHAFIGGCYRVVKDIPPYVLATGEPLRYAGINVLGLRRRGFDSDTRLQIQRAYRLIYRTDSTRSQALAAIRRELPESPEILTILEFFSGGDRSII